MEDLRTLLHEHEAQIAPEALGYLLRGLNAAQYELIQEGRPSDAKERQRYLEMLHAVAWSAELVSIALARWLGKHVDDCAMERRERP